MNVASFALLTLKSSFLLIGTARGAGTPCETFTDCTALKTAILDQVNDGRVNVCVSSTPIVCDETKKPIYLNDGVSMTSFQLNCVCNELECEEERCVLDYTPTSAYDGSKAYGGFILQDQRTLTVDGFDFVNLRGKGRLFYNQHGSTLTIRNSVFQNNVYTGLDGKNPIIVYDYTTSGPTSTTIENSLFQGNQGSLLGFQAGSAMLKNNIFYDNSLPLGYESAFTDTAFIFWKNITDTTFVLQGNQFHSFQAPASSGVDDKFFMISATDSSKSVSTDALLANVTGNCAANNDVAGNYTNSGLIPNGSILDCNSGVYTAGAWPYRECRLLEGQPECPLDYGPTGPPKPTIPTHAIGTATTDTCNIGAELHIVDQTRTQCANGKVSCKLTLSSSQNSVVNLKILEMPADYNPKNSKDYFDTALDVAPVNLVGTTACITHAVSSSASYLAIACWNGLDGSQATTCASKEVGDGQTTIKFMELTQKQSGAKKLLGASVKRAGKKKRRQRRALRALQEDGEETVDLAVTYPQYFIWDSDHESYPMILSSNHTLSIDVCLLVPEGYALETVLDAETDEELGLDSTSSCTQIIVPGEDVELFFKAVDLDPPARGRRLEPVQGHAEPNFEMIIKPSTITIGDDSPNIFEQAIIDETIPGQLV